VVNAGTQSSRTGSPAAPSPDASIEDLTRGGLADAFDAVLFQAQAGSARAFQVLYQALGGPVAAYVRGHGVRDVEDVTSEVFLSVFAGIHRFSGGLPEFRSWVFTIAHRRVVDEWRRAGRGGHQVPYESSEDHRTSVSAEDGALAAIGEDRVHAVLARLSPDQRDVLLLRVIADLTVEQVAAALKKRPGAVKALQRRGLAKLRQEIEAQGVPL
jgi:RNA polymerase sigma factor (sigma-70 family)